MAFPYRPAPGTDAVGMFPLMSPTCTFGDPRLRSPWTLISPSLSLPPAPKYLSSTRHVPRVSTKSLLPWILYPSQEGHTTNALVPEWNGRVKWPKTCWEGRQAGSRSVQTRLPDDVGAELG